LQAHLEISEHAGDAFMIRKSGVALAWLLITAVCLGTFAVQNADASLCGRILTATNYPHSASPNQVVSVSTTVSGSCTSDGEDYFAVRVDVVDKSSLVLSSNSTPIGYNANNFSIVVHNAARTPAGNQSWSVNVNTYLIAAGAASGKYLLNSTSIMIQVGSTTLTEAQPQRPLLLLATVMALAFRKKIG